MKNNSKRIVLLMVVFMVLILSSNSFAANEQPHVIQGVKVYIDGTLFQTESPFYNLNGFTLVPMRAIFEGLGAKVKWEQSTKTIVASTEERIIELTIDKDIAKINDKNHSLTVAPKLINNTTYVPLRFIAEALMYEVDWDSSNRVISIIDTRAISKVWQNRVDIYDGVIDLADIDLCEEDLLRLNILKDGQRVDIDYNVIGTKIVFKTELKLNTNYALRVITNEDKYEIRFTTGDLPEIYETGDRIIVKVPAMPEKGFNWPYYLAIPSNHYKNENQNNKRYLMVDTTNGGEKDLQGTEKWVYDTLENRYQYSVSVAEFLWTPMIMPVFPRTSVWYHDKYGEYNVFYEHALDRDTATLHNKVKDPEMRKMLEPLYKEKGFNIDDFLRLDKQLVAMFNHAVGYLNKYGYNVETDKMFLCGFSASGMFANRFTAFQPDKVKAVASGGTLDDVILPLSQYEGEKLIFPIGTYDYKEIVGKDFDLSKYNSVARLIYTGKNDTNNTVPYYDCYGDTEREIIIKLWGEPVLPRTEALIKVYGQSGGKGILILDKDIGHDESRDMESYVLEFFKANRDIDEPVYPIPTNPDQLQYTLYE